MTHVMRRGDENYNVYFQPLFPALHIHILSKLRNLIRSHSCGPFFPVLQNPKLQRSLLWRVSLAALRLSRIFFKAETDALDVFAALSSTPFT
jgi:hypothetical protein